MEIVNNGSHQEFLDSIKDLCIQCSNDRHNDMPASVLAGLSAYISNYGKDKSVESTNNLFKNRTDKLWSGKVYNTNTDTIEDTGDGLKVYDSIDTCFSDFAEYISTEPRFPNNPNILKYENALESNSYEDFINELYAAGFLKAAKLRDNNFVDNVVNIINENKLYKWDKEALDMSKEEENKKITLSDKVEIKEDVKTSPKKEEIFRVVLDLDGDKESKLLVTSNLDEAIELCKKHPGYKVYNKDNHIVYPNLSEGGGSSLKDESSVSSPIILQLGTAVELNSTPVYRSYDDKLPFASLSGTFYIYDTIINNGRTRLSTTNNPNKINGKDPGVIIGCIEVK